MARESYRRHHFYIMAVMVRGGIYTSLYQRDLSVFIVTNYTFKAVEWNLNRTCNEITKSKKKKTQKEIIYFALFPQPFL